MIYRNGISGPPIVTILGDLFEQIEDEGLIRELEGPVRRGPKGHDPRILLRCILMRYAMGLPSTAAMLRTLHDNPYAMRACGIYDPDQIPHESTFSRFIDRLTRRFKMPKLKDVSRSLVRRCYATIPGFGNRVALDGSVIKAWSNGSRPVKADPEAGFSIKTGSQGAKEITYGYKLHLMVDCETELPISANVSAGNVHDMVRATNVLSEARFTHSRFNPDFVMADAGYSGKDLFHLIRKNYSAQPIIRVNKGHKRLWARGKDRQQSTEFKALSKQRVAVERVFGRLKTQRALNMVSTRRLRKVTAHVYLSLIAHQATVLAGTLVNRV